MTSIICMQVSDFILKFLDWEDHLRSYEAALNFIFLEIVYMYFVDWCTLVTMVRVQSANLLYVEETELYQYKLNIYYTITSHYCDSHKIIRQIIIHFRRNFVKNCTLVLNFPQTCSICCRQSIWSQQTSKNALSFKLYSNSSFLPLSWKMTGRMKSSKIKIN